MIEKPSFADLIIPLYIDAETVLSLLGWIEGGIDVKTSVTVQRSSSRKRSTSVSAEAEASSSVFSMFKVKANGGHDRSKDQSDNEEWAYERTDTIGSLLQRLRSSLQTAELLPAVGDTLACQKLGTGEFVEFSGTFEAHPLVQALDTAQRLLSLFETFVGGTTTNIANKTGNKKGKGGGDAQRPLPTKVSPGFGKLLPGANLGELSEQLPILQHINTQLLGPLRKELITGVSRTYVVSAPGSDYRAVVTLLDDFVRNLEAEEIVGREFRVLGKVGRHVADSSDGIGLLRGSSLALFGDKIQPLADQAAQAIGFPTIETTVSGPVLEIVPIAVYV